MSTRRRVAWRSSMDRRRSGVLRRVQFAEALRRLRRGCGLPGALEWVLGVVRCRSAGSLRRRFSDTSSTRRSRLRLLRWLQVRHSRRSS
jgi:hypothetical protein